MRVLAIFAASRVVTTVILLAFAANQATNPWTGPSPDYLSFATIWDGHWYRIIAAVGYPSELPLTDTGAVGENAWAFMPAYPMLVRALMVLTGLSYGAVAVAVSVLCAAGAALVFHRLMSRVLSGGSALFATTLFCFAPLSPILQVAYAESMQLLLLFTAFLLLLDRRYLLALPVVALMALTRPSGLAFAFLLLMHLVQRFVTRGRDPFPWRERGKVVVLGLWSFAWGLAWPGIAWLVTGSMTAYTDTELAWRVGYIGEQHLVPFTSWIQGAQFWIGWWWNPAEGALLPLSVVAILALVALWGAFLLTPWARRLGPDLRLWLVAYPTYLLAVFFPQSSTFRLLMPLAPALGALAVPRSRWWRAGLLVLAVAGQVAWMHLGWWVNGSDWSPP